MTFLEKNGKFETPILKNICVRNLNFLETINLRPYFQIRQSLEFQTF